MRPPDLADYRAPPVTEVVLGVQFNSVERFLSPHLGLVWERFKSTFPNWRNIHRFRRPSRRSGHIPEVFPRRWPPNCFSRLHAARVLHQQ